MYSDIPSLSLPPGRGKVKDGGWGCPPVSRPGETGDSEPNVGITAGLGGTLNVPPPSPPLRLRSGLASPLKEGRRRNTGNPLAFFRQQRNEGIPEMDVLILLEAGAAAGLLIDSIACLQHGWQTSTPAT